MKILAVEFSSDRRSVAVADVAAGAQAVVLGAVIETVAPQTKALAMVESALAQASVEREAIECIAVGLGPGSYTGIRAAISLAQGWQLARGVRLLGVESVECLAAQAQLEGRFGRVNLVVDAQRNEFYLAGYEITATERRRLEPLRLVAVEEVRRRVSAGETVAGPEAGRLLTGAVELWPEATVLAQLAAGRSDFVPGEALMPVYLRAVSFVKAPAPRWS
jgi:tRNA threonylcarbamoyl adenosine modification protein YeaZ